MKKYLLFLALFVIAPLSQAQIFQELRKEIDLKDNGVDQLRVLGDKGLIVFGYVNEKGAADNLQINAYSTNFELQSTVELDYPKRALFASVIVSNDNTHVYFFYLLKNYSYIILDYDVDTRKVTERSEELRERFTPVEMRNMKNKLYIHGRKKGVPVLMTLDPATGQHVFTEIPGENRKRVVETIMEDKDNERLAIFYRDGKSMKASQFYVCFFDGEGDLLDNPSLIDRNEAYSVIDGSITWLSKEEFIISGTYGLKDNRLASGIYFSKFHEGTQEFITYHSFTEFSDFFSYLPQRQQDRIERQKNRKKNRGKEDFIKSLVEIHPIQVKDGYYVFVGEVYYATYRTETYTTFVNGRATTQTRQVFDGYQYSHAVVAGLDQQGKKLFDHCFSMWLVNKPFRVVKNIHISNDGDQTKLFFSTGSELKAAILTGDQLSQHDYGRIVTDNESDNVRWTSFTRSDWWYGNYYIVYGSQKIKNRGNEGVDRKRIVFFMSKIELRE